ncbi:3-phosphoshikimate 1-carboxyvinyltransferase [Porphyromonas loveana]|uniref:3-phosphoshikimate 1-carboxyvinyltransferase n=1 Tax=Porphyromonas loveana TaxID=1884669 RepID=UPI0035A1A34D
MKSLHCTFNPIGMAPEVSLTLPSSKSEWIRLLLLRAMSGEALAPLSGNAPTDVQVVHRALTSGLAGRIDVQDAGTAMRFLTAYAARFATSPVLLQGTERMHARPIGPLVEALRSLGADLSYEGAEGFPPLSVRPAAMREGKIRIDAGMSSQFVSALLLIAPTLPDGLHIELTSREVSAPYTEMTCRLLTTCGIDLRREESTIVVRPGTLAPPDNLSATADWSSASYIYNMVSAGAIKGKVRLDGLVLPPDSMQADSRAAELFGRLGVLTIPTERGIALCYRHERQAEDFGSANMRDCPDLVPALTVCCLLKGVPFRLTGIGHLRLKESDRLEAICTEAGRLGYAVHADGDALYWDGERHKAEENPVIRVYKDHRLAMAFAAAAMTTTSGIVLEDASVVGKSFPDFLGATELLGLKWEEV